MTDFLNDYDIPIIIFDTTFINKYISNYNENTELINKIKKILDWAVRLRSKCNNFYLLYTSSLTVNLSKKNHNDSFKLTSIFNDFTVFTDSSTVDSDEIATITNISQTYNNFKRNVIVITDNIILKRDLSEYDVVTKSVDEVYETLNTILDGKDLDGCFLETH